MAGRPVIVNRRCAAVADLAQHERNALLVTADELPNAIRRLLDDEALGAHLATAGRATAKCYTHAAVNAQFIQHCDRLTSDVSARTASSSTSNRRLPASSALRDIISLSKV